MVAFDFSAYLTAILQDRRYHDIHALYTETDALLTLEAETVEQKRAEDPELAESEQQKVEPFPVLEGLCKYALGEQREHVLLAGRPGSGKSTTLKRLLLMQAEAALGNQTRPIPVLVQLKGDCPILTAIANELEKGDLELEPKEIKRLLRRNRLVLLLDGVNEIPSESLRRQLQDFRENNLTAPMVFTTRDLAVGGDLGIEKRLEMRPLSETQMRAFVQKYLPEHGEALLGQLKDRLREIAETPLLLKMLCDVFDPETRLIPQSKGELFRLFDQKYDKFKGIAPASEDFRRFKSEILRHLAFGMMQGNPDKPLEAWLTVDRDLAERWLEDLLQGRVEAPGQRAKEWLEDLVEHHLLQIAANPRQIEFHHQLFQEYYAAEALLVMLRDGHPDMKEDQRLQHFYLNYLKWTESITMLLALLEDETQALRLVRLALDVDLMLGARLAGEVQVQFQARTVKLLTELQLPEHVRIELLGITESEQAKSTLFQALNSPDIHLVETAASYIGETKNQIAIKEIQKRLKDIDEIFFSQTTFGGPDRTGQTWTSYVRALSHLAPHKAVAFLRQKIDKKGMILETATEAPSILMQLDGHNLVPELLEKLRSSKFDREQDKLLDLIERSANHELVAPRLIEILNRSENKNIQKRIIKILGKTQSESANKKLIELITEKDYLLRDEASRQLTTTKNLDAPSINRLCELAEFGEWSVSWNAVVILGNLGDVTSVPRLLHELEHHPEAKIRASAAKALGIVRDEISISLLLKRLEAESDSLVRMEVAFALSSFGREEAVPELMTALRSGYVSYKTVAIRCLANLKILDPLIEIVRSEASGWQTAAVELGKLGRSEVLPALFKVLINPRYEAAGEIISILTKLADSEMLKILTFALQNPSQYTEDRFFPNRVALVLAGCKRELIENHLSSLKKMMRLEHIHQLFWIIPAIQFSCQFYNYDIAQLSLSPLSSPLPSGMTVCGDYVAGDKVMRDKIGTIYNVDQVGTLNTGIVNVQGNQVGIQHLGPPD
jgi:HEAT repeat protein